MYTLSRVLPDGTERPIVSGPPGRSGPSDPAACEFLPGETIRIGWALTVAAIADPPPAEPLAELSLDDIGQLRFLPLSKEWSPSVVVLPRGSGEATITILDGRKIVAELTYLEDVRVFARVFPKPIAQAPAPVA